MAPLTWSRFGGECKGDIKLVSSLTERHVFIWERACCENNIDQQTEHFCSGVQREERAGQEIQYPESTQGGGHDYIKSRNYVCENVTYTRYKSVAT